MCKRHRFNSFGRPVERCVNCGVEDEEVTLWRRKLVAELAQGITTHDPHPYLKDGTVTRREYMKMMRS